MDFTHLHCHSVFSFFAGVCTIKELVTRAKTLGMKALVLTDTDRMSGLVQFYLECKKQEIKPILGVELTMPGKPLENLVILAKNSDGYGDICEIVTRRHIDQKTFSFADTFSKPWPNLFLLTNFPSIFGLLSHTPNRENLFGELIDNSRLTRERSRKIERTAQQHQIPLVVSNDSFFLYREEWQTHRILRAIGLISTVSRLRDDEYASSSSNFKTWEEMQMLFPRHKKAIENTERIAEQCNVSLPMDGWIMPVISVPDGYTPQTYLEKLAMQGDCRFLHGLSPACREKLRKYGLKKIGQVQQLERDALVKRFGMEGEKLFKTMNYQ